MKKNNKICHKIILQKKKIVKAIKKINNKKVKQYN